MSNKLTHDWQLVRPNPNLDFKLYTFIDYAQMKKYGLSRTEYGIVSLIYNTCRKTQGGSRWSRASSSAIAKSQGLSVSQVNRLLKKLIKRQMLEQSSEGLRVYWNKSWHNARQFASELTDSEKRDRTFSKIHHDVRKKLKLSNLEYSLLSYLQNLVLTSSITCGDRRVTLVSKSAMAKKLLTNRETVSRAVKRLEERRFLAQFTAEDDDGRKRNCIWLIVDMDFIDEYDLDNSNRVYYPESIAEILNS